MNTDFEFQISNLSSLFIRAPSVAKSSLSAPIELGHDELAMPERFGTREPTVGGSGDQFDQRVARLVDGHFAAQDGRHVQIDVLFHRADGDRVARELDHRLDGVAADVSLPGREQVNYCAR